MVLITVKCFVFLSSLCIITKYSSLQTHVYEVIQNVNKEELQQQRPCKREAAATDSFYHLLQAVN